MILFLDDWKKYPDAKLHLSTTNQSFIRLSGIYKSMGIKNHGFMLSLLDPTLEHVDPYDPELDIDTINRIVIECKRNFWYYIREIARAPALSGSDPVRFKANRGNIALYWLFFNHVTTGLEMIRQTGKSFSTDVLMAYLLDIRCKNTLINLLTKDTKLRSENIERLRNIIKTFPPYLNLICEHGKDKDIFNTEMLTIKALGNKYRGHVPQANVLDAVNQGRGLTSPIFHIDEAPFQDNIEYSLPAALAAGGYARELARKNKEPHGTIITTTAGRLEDPSGRYIYNLFMSSAKWEEKILDCRDREELYNIIRKQSSKGKLRVYAKFNHRQLGYTDAWLKRTIEESMASGDSMRMDYFGEWLSGNISNPLDTKTLDKIKHSRMEDYYAEITKDGYIIRWLINRGNIDRLQHHDGLVLGIDTSEAAGDDDIAMCLTDVYTGEVLACCNINETNLIQFSTWLLSWYERFPNITIIIERRSTGGMIIDYLLNYMSGIDIDPLSGLFNWIIQEKDENPTRYEEAKKHTNNLTRYKKLFGYTTSGSGKSSRDNLYGTTLTHAAKYTGHLIKDPVLIDQINSLTTKKGRIDHVPGGKDDLVIAYLLTRWFAIYGKHLSLYGIDKAKILQAELLSKQSDTNSDVTDVKQQIEYQRNLIYKNKILNMIEQLKKEKNPIKAAILEREIVFMSKRIGTTISGFNADAVIEEVKEIRKKLTRYK